jgi:predicted GNAT family acetyltransferase
MAEVIHDINGSRFYFTESGKECYLRYEHVDNETIVIITTYVPNELRGKGLAAQLAKSALEYAKENNLKVIPQCGYIRSYVERNKEYQTLIK